MLFAEDGTPDLVKWLTGGGAIAFLTWFATYMSTRRKELRTERADDEKKKRELAGVEEERARKIKIEDESRMISHMQSAIDNLKVDNGDMRKQVGDLKAEMRQMQIEMRSLSDGKVSERLRAERYRLYSEHLEDVLRANKIEFRRWTEEDDDDTTTPNPAFKGA